MVRVKWLAWCYKVGPQFAFLAKFVKWQAYLTGFWHRHPNLVGINLMTVSVCLHAPAGKVNIYIRFAPCINTLLFLLSTAFQSLRERVQTQ